MSFAKSICMYAVVVHIGSSFCVHKGRARGGGDAIFVCLVGLFYIVWPETTWSSVQLIYVPWEVQRCLTFSCFPFIWSKGFSTKSQSIYGSAQRSGNACSLAKEEGFFGTSKFFFPFGSRTKKHGYKNSIPASAATGSKMERDIF